jgi:SPP1 gp7 family putative phage head morphogenesis protein
MPMAERATQDSFLANFLAGAEKTVPPPETRSMPLASGAGVPPLVPPRISFPGEPGEPVIRLPIIDRAAASLIEKRAVTPEQFRALDVNAKRAAFTVAKLQSTALLGRVQKALIDDVREGGTLQQFRAKVADAVDGVLSPSQVETVYRSQLGLAQAAGQRAVISNPMVADAFPYVMWVATRDTRVRETHLEMERHGQNGSAVYRRDDPIWNELWAPAEWNCRCAIISLSLEDAARHGSREAKRWLETDVPPANPEFAQRPYPIIPPGGWPRPGELAAAV